jgi:PAS domain S-box-containing protein
MFTLSNFIDSLVDNKLIIAKRWVNKEVLQEIFTRKAMDLYQFETVYAIGVVEYFIGVLDNSKKLGNCPVMHVMLNDFAEHNITSQEIFFICAQFKRTLMKFAFEQGFADIVTIDEINYLLDENFGGVIKAYDDIIHRHVVDLERNEKRFLEYTNAIDAGTIISKTDPGGKITYVNREFELISGYSKEELLGKSHSIVRHPDMPRGFYEELWETINAKKIFLGTIKNRHKNGNDYFIKTCIAPILDTNDEIVEFIAIRQDITELMHSLEHEHKVNALKDDFLRNMSHEIRTPLNAIAGSASLLLKKMDDPKHEKYVTLINNGATQLMHIMSHILELSQLSSGTYKSESEKQVIYEKLENSCSRFEPIASEKGVEFVYSIGLGLQKPLFCDYRLIQRIVDSLVENAIKFTDKGGKVAIKISMSGDKLSIKVKDNGIGINEEQIDEIFRPFHQVDSSTVRRHDGIGVGLALIKQIVEFLDGTIEVQSTKGEGSLFSVTLPSR